MAVLGGEHGVSIHDVLVGDFIVLGLPGRGEHGQVMKHRVYRRVLVHVQGGYYVKVRGLLVGEQGVNVHNLGLGQVCGVATS